MTSEDVRNYFVDRWATPIDYDDREVMKRHLDLLLDEHGTEVAIDMRERCRAAAHATAPNYTNVCWKIMSVPIKVTGKSNESI